MRKENIRVELCDFNNREHTGRFTELLNHYIEDPMGDSIPLDEVRQALLLEELKANSKAFVLLLFYQEQIVGFSTLFELFSTFKVKPYLYIHDFVVYGNYRGKGLGRSLMDGVVALAKQLQCCKITLEVRSDNHPAQKLYKNCGFTPCEPDMYFWTKPLM
ncbi:MAG: GNAT family N-acetyltransferase [Dysgonamonadaceae bacterium]|jgi:ribosomal protein S18 acetylase RimI-like enzyme|nr:GNAT family N-acetyltransferase [Dysgonamonadaceae bacterium]